MTIPKKRVGSMFPQALAGARAAGLALFAAALLAACGSDNSPQTPAATPAASRLVLDTGSAAPVAGGTLTLKAMLLAADGTEVKGASFAWTSSDPTVATIVSASDKAPAASVIAPVGIYATVQTLAAGAADITATATLADGTHITSVTHLVVQATPAKSYTLALTPATVSVVAGGAAQTVTVAVRRSDGVDGAGDLSNWSWTSDNASFVATPAADGRSAQVVSPATAYAAGAATLTACADAPAGARLCANAALSRNAMVPPTYTVGGTIVGLAAGKSLQLADTNGDTQVVTANGSFVMATPRMAGTAYGVTVTGQPAGQTCTLTNGSGTLAAANVASIVVTCTQARFVVVANQTDNTVSVYRTDPGTGALSAVPGSPFATTYPVSDLKFLPSGLRGYATSVVGNSMGPLDLNPATGAIATRPPSETLFDGPMLKLAIHPSGLRAMTIKAPAVTLATVTLPVPGSATAPVVELPLSLGGTPLVDAATGLLIYNDGKSGYLSGAQNESPNSTGWVIELDPSNGTNRTGYQRRLSGFMAGGAAVRPGNGFLYEFERNASQVAVSTLDPTTGFPATLPFIQAVLERVMDMAFIPTGERAFLLGPSGTIRSAWSDPVTGLLIQNTSVLAAPNSQHLAIDAAGQYLYVPAPDAQIFAFAIDQGTGVLTPLAGSPFATGRGNVAIAIVEPKS